MKTFERFDQSEKSQLMRTVLINNDVLLLCEEMELALYDINFDKCKLYVRNVIDEEGNLSSVPSFVYELVTFDEKVFDVEILRIDPNENFFDLYSDIVGQVDLWW